MSDARRRRGETDPVFLIVILLIGVVVGGGVVGAVAFAVFRTPQQNAAQAPAEPLPGAPAGDRPSPPASKNNGGSGQANSSRSSEKTLEPDQTPLDTPLRPHRDHPWVKLIQAEIEKPDGSRMPLPFWRDGERIVLDYESSGDFLSHPVMTHARVFVMLKNEKGEEIEWHYQNYAHLRDNGHWLMADGSDNPVFRFPGPPGRFGFGRGSAEKSFTPNMEIYVMLEDWTDRKAQPLRFKISNSLTIGDQPRVTLARNWLDDEAKRIEHYVNFRAEVPAPPLQTMGGVTAGSITVLPPGAERSDSYGAPGGWKYEFAQDKKPVLGFAYRFGTWDNHPSIGAIRPLFTAQKDKTFPEAAIAKAGYAVGGVNLELSPFVSGFQVVFMKLTADNRLDPKDQYLGDWIRAEKVQGQPQKPILSDGRLVIGVQGNNGAVVNTMGLIFQ